MMMGWGLKGDAIREDTATRRRTYLGWLVEVGGHRDGGRWVVGGCFVVYCFVDE